MKTAGRITIVVALLIVAWIAIFSGDGSQAPDGPVLPSTSAIK